MSYDLLDDEAALLNGKCRPEIQTMVDAAMARLAAVVELPDIPAPVAMLIADMRSHAEKTGEIQITSRPATDCRVCGRTAQWSKPRRKRTSPRQVSFAAVDLACGFVFVQHYIRTGCCRECFDKWAPKMAEALRGVRAQLPPQLLAGGAVALKRWKRAGCACGWEGHEGEMGREPTIMGNGTYAATCPNCDRKRGIFGDNGVRVLDGFVLMEVTK